MIGTRGTFARSAVVVAMAIGCALIGTTKDGCHERVDRDALTHEQLEPGDIYRGAPLFNDNLRHDAIKHFGLKSDRGLPIAVIEGGDGDALVAGASPKVWRYLYKLAIGLVASNGFPSWLPTAIYGTDWWYTQDWRAHLWASSYDSEGRPRLEVTNGEVFLECVGDTPTIQVNFTFTCPDDLQVKPSYINGTINVDYPDGTRKEFLTAKTNGVYGGEGRYDGVKDERLVDTKYVTTRRYIRQYIGLDGTDSGGWDPGRKIQRIVEYSSKTGVATDQTKVTTAVLIWKDTNAPTRDCAADPGAEPQCEGGLVCYDQKCTGERVKRREDSCYGLLCGDYGKNPWLQSSIINDMCKQVLCNGLQSCWTNRTPCQSPPAGDGTGQDWKLGHLITPMAATRAPQPGGNKANLTYTFLYGGGGAQDAMAGVYAGTKFLRSITDNTGPGAKPTDYPEQFPSYFHGKGIQFGYDRLNYGRSLKSVSFEIGRDVHVKKIEETNERLLQRFWGDLKDPHLFRHTPVVNSGSMNDTITYTTPHGLKTVMRFAPIGARLPTGTPCDPIAGCNIQLGLMGIDPPMGGTIARTYYGAEDGPGRSGELKSEAGLDGTVRTHVLNDNGYITMEKSDCVEHHYEYKNADFNGTWTTDVVKVDGETVRTHTRTLCSASSAKCPPYDYGQATNETVTYPNPDARKSELNVTYPEGGGKTVTSKIGAKPRTLFTMAGINPVSGEAQNIALAGTTLKKEDQPNVTVDPATPTAPVCDVRVKNCAGTTADKTTGTATVTPYWPTELVHMGVDMGDALKRIGLSAPAGKSEESVIEDVNIGGGVVAKEEAKGAGVTSGVSFEYDAPTGNVTAKIAKVNDVTLREDFKFGNAAITWNTPATKMHPTAMLERKVTVSRGAQTSVVGGSWFEYPMQDGMIVESWRGPKKNGILKADGSRAPADMEIVVDPRGNKSFEIGCTEYSAQGTSSSGRCVSDDACQCGYCDLSIGAGLYGNCRTTTQGAPIGYVCRHTFRGDQLLTQWENPSATRLHTTEWMQSQCVAAKCIQTTLQCTNPK